MVLNTTSRRRWKLTGSWEDFAEWIGSVSSDPGYDSKSVMKDVSAFSGMHPVRNSGGTFTVTGSPNQFAEWIGSPEDFDDTERIKKSIQNLHGSFVRIK